MRQRADADAQLGRTIGDALIRNFLLQNLIRTDGGYAWRVNLDALAANVPELLGFPAPGDDAVYRGPALFLASGRSPYVKADHRPLVERLFP